MTELDSPETHIYISTRLTSKLLKMLTVTTHNKRALTFKVNFHLLLIYLIYFYLLDLVTTILIFILIYLQWYYISFFERCEK